MLYSLYSILVYLKDSNAASHFVNRLILFALSRTGILLAHALQKNVSNRWYAPALRVRKSQNGSGCNKFFGNVSLCNLCKSQKINQMVLWSLEESPNQVRFRRSRPKKLLLDLIIWFYQLSYVNWPP